MEKNIDEPEEVEVSQLPKYWLPSCVYDALKWIALVLLPLVAVAYPQIADTWGMPYAAEIAKTASYAGLCVGVLIGASEIKAVLTEKKG